MFSRKSYDVSKSQTVARDRDISSNPDNAIEDPDRTTRVHSAVLNHLENPKLLGRVLKQGACVNVTDHHGQSPLHLAVEQGYLHCVTKLLKHKATVNAFGTSGYQYDSPLMIAARHGYGDIMVQLIKAGALVNLANSKGEVPLHHASSHGHPRCIEILLENKAKANYPDQEGTTPLNKAIQGRAELKAVQNLIKGKANVNQTDRLGRTSLHFVAMNGTSEVAQLLIKAGAELDKFDKTFLTPFVISINNNNAEVLKSLIHSGCDRHTIDGLNGTALALAALKGHNACVKVLVGAGEDLDEFGFFSLTPLMAASYESHLDVVETLLERGADPNVVSRMGLHSLLVAMSRVTPHNVRRRQKIVVRLIQWGADVNYHVPSTLDGYFVTSQISDKCCPVSLSIKEGLLSFLEMLLIAGGSVSCPEVADLLGRATLEKNDTKAAHDIVRTHFCRPLSLKDTCRSIIRGCLGRNARQKARYLPIANPLVEYLQFADIEENEVKLADTMQANTTLSTPIVSVLPCSLGALQGTFLHDTIREPIMAASSGEPCNCKVCQKIASMVAAAE